MKKLFLLIPALVLALMANAKVLDIAPNSPQSSDNIRREIRDHINAGDTLRLADGTYTEAESIAADKDVVIIAADGASPIVRLASGAYIKVSNSSKVVIKGIKFDGATNSTQYAIRAYDASASEIRIEDCEFYGFIKYIITSSESTHTDSLLINNCYFHNNIGRAAVYFPQSNVENQQTCYGVKITNSTFANNDASNEYVGIIDVRSYGLAATEDIEVLVDHCTFYNNITKNTDYASVNTREINRSTVSNCIFAHSEAYARRATFMYSGSNAVNCITYNLTTDADKYGHTWMTSRTGCFSADPLFTDAANGDYSYAGTYGVSMSPARGAGTDGSDLGDPRWYTDVTYPTTDFAGGYAFTADKAELSGNIIYETGAPEPQSPYLRYNHSWKPGVAEWTIKATKACYVSATVNMADNTWNYDADDNVRKYFQNHKHIFIVELRDANNNLLDSLQEGDHNGDGSSDGWDTYPTVNLQGTIHIPAEGVYTIRLKNNRNESRCGVNNVTLTYVGGEVQSMPGTTNINDAWFSPNATRTAGEKIVVPAGQQDEGWVKWNVSFANAASYKVKVNINSSNGHNYTVALYRDKNDQNPITWGEGGQTSAVSPLDLGSKEVPAGNYILEVTNDVKWSDAALISVQFIYEGGAVITLPGTLTLMEAVLSPLAYKEASTNYIHFTDDEHVSQVPDQWAKWNVQAALGVYSFTFEIKSSNYGKYVITVLDSQNNPVYTHEYDKDGDGSYTTEGIVLNGNYTVQMQNMQAHSKGYITSMSSTKDNTIFIIDENATDGQYIADMDGISKQALLKRTFKGGMYNTFCIPVEPGLGELTSVFGAGYELLELTSAELVENTLNLIFTNATSVLAGKPYLIKPAADVVNPVIPQHGIHNYTTNHTVSCTNADFIGSFIKGEVPAGENNLFLGQDNLLYFSQTATPIKGMRAYFQLKGIDNPQQAIKRARLVTPNNMPTDIDLVNGESKAIKRIENGQVIIVRDGIRYNVMGVKLQ